MVATVWHLVRAQHSLIGLKSDQSCSALCWASRLTKWRTEMGTGAMRGKLREQPAPYVIPTPA